MLNITIFKLLNIKNKILKFIYPINKSLEDANISKRNSAKKKTS